MSTMQAKALEAVSERGHAGIEERGRGRFASDAWYAFDITTIRALVATGQIVPGAGVPGFAAPLVTLPNWVAPRFAPLAAQPVDLDDDDDDADTCDADGCDQSLDDGEGYDGYCGTHADEREAEGEYA